MIGRLRSPRRRTARTAGGLLVAATTGALLLGGASPADARTVPAPSPSVSTPAGLSVHLDLGLLKVHVDLPPLTNLLGGAPTPSTVTRRPAAVVPVTPTSPTSVPRTAAPRTTAPASRPTTARPTSTRRLTPVRSVPNGGGAGIDSGRDVPRVTRTSPPASKSPRKTVTKQQIAEANETFERALHPGAPAWLLLSVVGLCALGTAGFVRLAGRKDRAGV